MTTGEKHLPSKVYLGDGCYAEHSHGVIVLTTENGIRTTNRIVLEPEVLRALVTFAERVVEDEK